LQGWVAKVLGTGWRDLKHIKSKGTVRYAGNKKKTGKISRGGKKFLDAKKSLTGNGPGRLGGLDWRKGSEGRVGKTTIVWGEKLLGSCRRKNGG